MKLITDFLKTINISSNKKPKYLTLLDDDLINKIDLKSNYSFQRIAIIGIIMGFIAFFVPFMKITLSLNNSEIEQLLGAFTNKKNEDDIKSYSLFIFVQLNEIRFSEDLKIVILQKLIFAMPIILLIIIVLYELNLHFYRKFANVLFILMTIVSIIILGNIGLKEIEIGCYLMTICCLILMIDTFIPSPNRVLIETN